METPMQKWYAGRSVFITGGTGFMGKVLIEKLLRCLPSIGNVYVLMRAKRGVSPKERIENLSKLALFDRLKRENPNAMSKLIAIEGDLCLDSLGISEEDRKLLKEEVSIVYHAGANLKLEANLKDALLMNTVGTKRVLEFAKEMKKLECFIHVSTAFCHCDVEVLEEKIYPPTKDPYALMEMALTNSAESLSKLEEKMIQPFPNTYTFTKRLAETVAYDYSQEHNIPLMIARPSIVIPSLHEPVPGWVDSLNGPVGVMIASGKGVLRSMMVKEGNHCEVMPVDIAINILITMPWFKIEQGIKETQVMNLTQSQDILSITWEEILDRGKKQIWNAPFEWMLWYPDGGITTNRLYHNLITILFQWIPAYFIDFLFFILRMPRFMVRVQQKIKFGQSLLEYFTLREWRFLNKNALSMSKYLTKEDLDIFYMANATFDIDEYLKMTIYGARTYCLKENPKSVEFWKKYLTFLWFLDRICKAAFVYYTIYWTLCLFGLGKIMTTSYWQLGRSETFL